MFFTGPARIWGHVDQWGLTKQVASSGSLDRVEAFPLVGFFLKHQSTHRSWAPIGCVAGVEGNCWVLEGMFVSFNGSIEMLTVHRRRHPPTVAFSSFFVIFAISDVPRHIFSFGVLANLMAKQESWRVETWIWCLLWRGRDIA